QKHDLRSLQPIRDNFGLIVCKNVLLHLQEPERIDVIKMFHKCLAPDGFLATEQTQKMPARTAYLFRQVNPKVQLFQKK
ncbi:MAG: chemotaxis protein CheR, partial [Desulfobacterales bacterium]|nr:chemotaxis protein CheR [Desulfobacterales bacterium]